MTNLRIGVQFMPQHGEYDGIRQSVAQAEELGVDVAFNWDHFYPLSGDPDGLHFECWTMLAAWAEATERMEIGALVTCNSYRNPQLLADMARTVDHISDGRLILGIGSGWFQRDYDEYGYEFGTGPSRLRDLRASLPMIKERWAKLNPVPTRDIPILIGGGGEKVTLRLVAEHAATWHGFGAPEVYKHKLNVLQGHCETVGRDYDDIEKSATISVQRNPDPADLGDAYYDLGARLIVFSTNGPEWDLSFLGPWLEWRDAKNG